MVLLVCKGLYIFFFTLEIALCLSILCSWLPIGTSFKQLLAEFLEPLLTPIRYCLRHSIFQTKLLDLSPLLALIILSYLQTFFYQLTRYGY